MRWQREGRYGMISEPYRVGKFTVDEGSLCTLYGLWHEKELLGYFNDFNECKEKAEIHNSEIQRAFPASGEASSAEGSTREMGSASTNLQRD